MCLESTTAESGCLGPRHPLPLIQLALALADWAIENHPRIEDARAACDAAHQR